MVSGLVSARQASHGQVGRFAAYAVRHV